MRAIVRTVPKSCEEVFRSARSPGVKRLPKTCNRFDMGVLAGMDPRTSGSIDSTALVQAASASAAPASAPSCAEASNRAGLKMAIAVGSRFSAVPLAGDDWPGGPEASEGSGSDRHGSNPAMAMPVTASSGVLEDFNLNVTRSYPENRSISALLRRFRT